MGFLGFKFVFIFFSGPLLILASSASSSSSNNNDVLSNVFTFSSFNISSTKLSPYDWRYMRVELPPFYSSTSVVINSDVSLEPKTIQKYPKRKLPIVCFREGGPPLPDVSDAALDGLGIYSSTEFLALFPVLNVLNGSAGGIQHLGTVDQCYTLQKSITFMLTCEQTPPGVYYFGLFNGLGPIRTQSKMINSGSSYTVSVNVTVEGCSSTTVWGQYCNQTVVAPNCVKVRSHNSKVVTRLIACGNFSETSCQNLNEPVIKSVKVLDITDDLVVWGDNVRSNQVTKPSELSLMCYARLNAILSENVYDHYSDISVMPLIIHYPKVGKWYFKLQPVYRPSGDKGLQENNMEVCYSAETDLYLCPRGETGPRCSWKRHALQAVPTTNSTVPVIYMPKDANLSLGSTNFSVEPLLSRSSHTDDLGYVWTYFLVNTSGAAAKNIHIQFTSETANFYALFIRFGGLPVIDSWDSFYLNKTLRISSTDHSFFKLYDTDGQNISIYILYAREGPWIIGLRNPVLTNRTLLPYSTMSISLEGCANQCSNHGICQSYEAAGVSTSYSCCSCDRNHGGFDCSIDVVSQKGRRWQSICLIFSNAAALLPAFWALWKKAGAESVIFTASGVLSAIYHACDVGWWCALRFSVLQFMDFWLSFMAVVSVFVYLVIISEAAKRTIHTIVAITTALIAAIDPTRATNIALVVAAAFVSLLVGCLQEFYYTKHASLSSNQKNSHDIFWRKQNFKEKIVNLTKRLWGYYRWSCLLLGLLVLSIAAITWRVQTSQTYWFWHSLWHVAICIAAFLFLCSKAKCLDNPHGRHATYEFAWLNS